MWTMDTTLFLALLNTDTNCGPFSVVLTGFDRNKSLLLNWIGPVSCFAAFSKLVMGLIHFQPALLIIHAEGKCSKSTTGSLKINPAAYFLLFRISSRCGGWANHNSGSPYLKSLKKMAWSKLSSRRAWLYKRWIASDKTVSRTVSSW